MCIQLVYVYLCLCVCVGVYKMAFIKMFTK